MNEIEVTLPLTKLGVLQAGMLVGRGFDRLGEEVNVFGEDRQFARVAASEHSVDADDVAQVELFDNGPVVVADLLFADHQLDVARQIANVDKVQLAFVAVQDDTTGGAHLGADHLAPFALVGFPLAEIEVFGSIVKIRQWKLVAVDVVGDLAVAGADVADERAVVEPLAPGIMSQLDEPSHFFSSGSLQSRRGFFLVFSWIGHHWVSHQWRHREAGSR